MFDFETVVELMKKYGYSSTSVHPYVYQNGDTWGICYTYIDEEYGLLERIKIFDTLEEFNLFLKQLEFVKTQGKSLNIRMVLDNYESMNPKVVFLRNEKVMTEGEMFDIEGYDSQARQRSGLDVVSQIIYKAGDLLLVYDEIKGRQLQYLKNIVTLKNSLRSKYFELQKEVDTYNKYKVERTLNLIPDVYDLGINDAMEMAIKDRYNMYLAQMPSYEEACDFLKEVWDLNKNLELNRKYYEAQKEENDTRNEMKVVELKLDLMRKLNEEYKPLFGIDLVGKFRKINKQCGLVSNSMDSSMIQENVDRIERKYSVYDSIDLLSTSDYLREAMQNTNYGDLVIKYARGNNRNTVITNKLPLNEVAASLSLQYRDRLDMHEQAIMILYNNHKYRKLCNAILDIEGYDSLPVKKVISKINGIKGFSKIKSECYDIVKKRIEDPLNASIKNSLFSGYDFTSFESFVSSLIQALVRLKSVNNRMVVNGNINMYLQIKKIDDVNNKKYILVTNDLNGVLNEVKENNGMVGIVLLKENTPVVYSPYYFDVGDIYSKGASLQMYIREMVNFELLVETSDIVIHVDPVKTNVVRYYSEPVVVDNVSVVNDIKMSYKTKFCKFAFTNNLPAEVMATESNPSQMLLVNQEGNLNQSSFGQEANQTILDGQGVVGPAAEAVVTPNVENSQTVLANPEFSSTGQVGEDSQTNLVNESVALEKSEQSNMRTPENVVVQNSAVETSNAEPIVVDTQESSQAVIEKQDSIIQDNGSVQVVQDSVKAEDSSQENGINKNEVVTQEAVKDENLLNKEKISQIVTGATNSEKLNSKLDADTTQSDVSTQVEDRIKQEEKLKSSNLDSASEVLNKQSVANNQSKVPISAVAKESASSTKVVNDELAKTIMAGGVQNKVSASHTQSTTQVVNKAKQVEEKNAASVSNSNVGTAIKIEQDVSSKQPEKQVAVIKKESVSKGDQDTKKLATNASQNVRPVSSNMDLHARTSVSGNTVDGPVTKENPSNVLSNKQQGEQVKGQSDVNKAVVLGNKEVAPSAQQNKASISSVKQPVGNKQVVTPDTAKSVSPANGTVKKVVTNGPSIRNQVVVQSVSGEAPVNNKVVVHNVGTSVNTATVVKKPNQEGSPSLNNGDKK